MTTPSVSTFDGCGAGSSEQQKVRPAFLAVYLLLGVAFGFVLSRSEVISWFRIQEMFRFQSFRAQVGLRREHRDSPQVTGKRDSLRRRRRDLRSGLGAHRRLPRTALRAHRQRRLRDDCRGGQRIGGNMGLRMAKAEAAALSGAVPGFFLYGLCCAVSERRIGCNIIWRIIAIV